MFLRMLFDEESGVLVRVNNGLYKDPDKFVRWAFQILYKLEIGLKSKVLRPIHSSYRWLVVFSIEFFLGPPILYGAVVLHELLESHEKLKENSSIENDAFGIFAKCFLGSIFGFIFVFWVLVIKMAFRYCRDCGFATRLRQLEKRIEEDIENAESEEGIDALDEIEIEKHFESLSYDGENTAALRRFNAAISALSLLSDAGCLISQPLHSKQMWYLMPVKSPSNQLSFQSWDIGDTF